MIKRDFAYYCRTIWLKLNALAYGWADDRRWLSTTKDAARQRFRELYLADFFGKSFDINHSFSKEYVAYRYLPNVVDYERHLRLDTEGVAWCRSDVVPEYNPLACAHFALVCYNHYLLNDDKTALPKFWKQVEYLYQKAKPWKNTLVYWYDDAMPQFEVVPPYYSGITQGVVASAFLRAAALSGAEKWTLAAQKLLDAMFIPIVENGVFTRTPEGYDWIEEYPSVSKPVFVLNGFVFSLIALYEWAFFTQDARYNAAIERLTEGLIKTLHEYFRGAYVRYSRAYPTFQNVEYQGLMVCQFLHLYELTGKETFRAIAAQLNKSVKWRHVFDFYRMKVPPYFESLDLTL